VARVVREAERWRDRPANAITVDVVVPVLDEAHVLARSVHTLHRFLAAHLPYRWTIVIAENGSTDDTADVARRLTGELDGVRMLTLPQRGRGDALRAAWGASHADILSYTDVDLSTDLGAFPRAFETIVRDGYDLAVGSRRLPAARVTRSFARRVLSHAYNELLHVSLDTGFTDAQTGFKAITHAVSRRVMPLVRDGSWFFDTELLVLAERLGYRIADLPVDWVEDHDSRVNVIQTTWDDIRGIARLRAFLRSGAFQAAARTAGKHSTDEGAVR
jgi:glycosyltransferase involved in cell wall biosynthesis